MLNVYSFNIGRLQGNSSGCGCTYEGDAFADGQPLDSPSIWQIDLNGHAGGSLKWHRIPGSHRCI